MAPMEPMTPPSPPRHVIDASAPLSGVVLCCTSIGPDMRVSIVYRNFQSSPEAPPANSQGADSSS